VVHVLENLPIYKISQNLLLLNYMKYLLNKIILHIQYRKHLPIHLYIHDVDL
jgi:hypothetical protein